MDIEGCDIVKLTNFGSDFLTGTVPEGRPFSGVCYSPDGTMYAGIWIHQNTNIFDSGNRSEIFVGKCPPESGYSSQKSAGFYSGYNTNAGSVSFSPDNSRLLVGFGGPTAPTTTNRLRSFPLFNFSSGAGVPPKQDTKPAELTQAEQMFTRPPFNMTAQQIIAARPQQ